MVNNDHVKKWWMLIEGMMKVKIVLRTQAVKRYFGAACIVVLQ